MVMDEGPNFILGASHNGWLAERVFLLLELECPREAEKARNLL